MLFWVLAVPQGGLRFFFFFFFFVIIIIFIIKTKKKLKKTQRRWDAIISVCLSSTFHATKAALPLMIEKGWGRVINTG